MRQIIIAALIYIILGLFTAILVLIKSETKLEKGTYLATALITFGWPVSIIHMASIFFPAVLQKGKKNVVASNKNNSDTNCSADSCDNIMVSSLKDHKEDTR